MESLETAVASHGDAMSVEQQKLVRVALRFVFIGYLFCKADC